jgi:hypothetical protein
MKTLRFYQNLVPLILSGKKYVTWRFFDDKNLLVGDELEFMITETGDVFGYAVILGVYEKKFGDVDLKDFVGHEEFSNREEMIETYKGYYDDSVNEETSFKIIKFKFQKK